MADIGIAALNNPRNKIHIVSPKNGTAICGRKGDLFGDKWFDSHNDAWDALIESGHGCLHCQGISEQDAKRLIEMYDAQ